MKKYCTYIGFVALALAGCSNDDLPKYSVLNSLRVLALVADNPNPDVSAGTVNVTITPYISEVNNNGQSIKFSASSCLDLGVGYGATPTCDGNPTKVVISQNQTLTIPVAPEYTGAADAFTVSVPSQSVMFAGRSDAEQFNGVNYLVTYQLVSDSGQSVKSFRRILVSNQSNKNHNPSVSEIRIFEGPVFASLPTETKKIFAIFDGGGEKYSLKNDQGETIDFYEKMTTTWFVTEGSFLRDRTEGVDTNEYSPPGIRPSSRQIVMVVVVRDDRGGVGVKVVLL